MTKTIILHTEKKDSLSNFFLSFNRNHKKTDYDILVHCKGYYPWSDEMLYKEITSFKSYYCYNTTYSKIDSLVELLLKCKTNEVIILDEDNPVFNLDKNNLNNFNFIYSNLSDILSKNLDTKYTSVKWFIIDLLSQIKKDKINFDDGSKDCLRYQKKVVDNRFYERIIHIDGGLGDHVMVLPLLEKIQNEIYISCKYPFMFEHLKVKGFINWNDDLFGGYSRFVYQYGTSNNSKTIIDAFFEMYGIDREENDILRYNGNRNNIIIDNQNKKIALICTSAAKIQGLDSNKDWKDIRWFKLVNELQKLGYYVIQVGTSNDNQIPRVDLKFLDKPISELAFLIDSCDFWISVDTFFHHFAASIKPDVGICLTPFYNDHAKHSGVTYIEKDCGKNYWDRRWWLDLQQPERKECMDLITVDDVLNTIITIEKPILKTENTIKINAYENSQFVGWVPDAKSPSWWLDENCKTSFEYFDLEGFYNEDYFLNDHVNDVVAQNYVSYVKYYYELLTQKQLNSVLEIGSAGGWFTKKFKDNGFEIFGVEGSKCGYEACLSKGILENEIIKHDLRNPLRLNKKYDIVCCTEVAEHLEIPFSGTLVKTLVDHADVVWFSSVSPGILGISPTYDHCNEQPEKFWINLFRFFGYDYYRLPDEVYNNTQLRGRYIFYNKKVYSFK